MSTNKKISNKAETTAPSSINGWTFQVAAAIYIFLCHIKETREIGLENTEDIELVLQSGKKIFAQAKSSLEPDRIETKTHYSEVYDAIRTLEGQKNSEIEKLIMIFNFYKPFGNDVRFDPTSFDKRSFENLTSKVKDKLNIHIKNKNYRIDRKKLEFWLLKFDTDNAHNKVYEFMKDKFISLPPASWEAVIEDWRCQLYDNASAIKRYIDKDLLAGSVMREYVNRTINEELLEKLDIEFLPGDFESIYLPMYTNLFHKVTSRFIVSNKIYKLYSDYIKSREKRASILYDFAKDSFKSCPDEVKRFFTETDGNYEDALCKLFLYNVGYKYTSISKVKELMGL